MSAKVVGIKGKLEGKDRPLKIAVGTTVLNHRMKNETMGWPQLVDRLREPVRTKETLAQYFKLPKESQDRIKDVGHYVPAHFEKGIRKKVNQSKRCLVTLDVDHAGVNYADDIDFTYGDYACVLHTTHKHRDDKPRLRLVFPLTRDVDEAEYKALARKLASKYAMDVFDDTTYDFARVMHWPSCSTDGEYVFEEMKGEWVDPDKILAEYDDWRDVLQWPVSSREIDRVRLSVNAKAENPQEKKGIVGAFCRSYTIHEAIEQFLPGVYVPGVTDDRLSFVGGSTSNGAVVYDDGMFLFSHHESDPCGGILVNAWDLVRLHKFVELDAKTDKETAPTKMPSFVAMRALVLDDERVKVEIAKERLKIGDEFEFDDEGYEVPKKIEITDLDRELGLDEKIEASEADWTKLLLLNDTGGYKPCLSNAELFLEHDDRLHGCVAENTFTAELCQMKMLPDMKRAVGLDGELWSDLAELKIKAYVEKRWGVSFSTQMIHDAAMTIGNRHSFNPVREWFDGLQWDNVPRVEEFFIREFGAADTAYTRAVTRKFFAAVVARVYRPGCKFDYMLVLEGAEGKGKSSVFNILANGTIDESGWFSDDMSFGYDSKEVVERTRGKIIVEIPEMVTRSNAEVEHVKSFLSRRVDRCRLSYARNAADYARQFVFTGSTNESIYLRSLTGNRRFWPIAGDGRKFDLERIRRDVPQLWAEAKEIWMWGEKLWLDDEDVEAEALAMQEARVVGDDLSGVIEAWLERPIRKNHWSRRQGQADDFDGDEPLIRRDRVCAVEVWVECLNEPIGRFNRREMMRINDILRRLKGWEARSSVNFWNRYGRTRGYLREL